MVVCTWSGLHRFSPSAIDRLTLKFISTETSTEVDMRRYFLELYPYISYCIYEHRCPVSGHLVSVGMIMRLLQMSVIIFIARCTEQNVWVGNVWYVPATEVVESSPWHWNNCVSFLLFILSACSHRFGSRSVKATTLTCTSLAQHVDRLISLFDAVQYKVLFYWCKVQVQFGYPVGSSF